MNLHNKKEEKIRRNFKELFLIRRREFAKLRDGTGNYVESGGDLFC